MNSRTGNRLKKADELYKIGRITYLKGINKTRVTRQAAVESGMEQIRDGARDLKKAAKLNPIKYFRKVTKLLISRGRWKFGSKKTRTQIATELYTDGRKNYLSAKKQYGEIIKSKPSRSRTVQLNNMKKVINSSKRQLRKAAVLSPIKYGPKVAKLLVSRGRWGFGRFNQRRKITGAIKRRLGPTAKQFRQTELTRLKQRTADTYKQYLPEIKAIDKTIKFWENRGNINSVRRFKNVRNTITNEMVGKINKDKLSTYKRIAKTYVKGVPSWFKK